MLRWDSCCVVGTKAVAVIIPDVFALPSVPRPTPVSAEPSSAGNVPLRLPAGRLVKFAPLPVKLTAVTIPVDSKLWPFKFLVPNSISEVKVTELIPESDSILLTTILPVSYTHLTLPTKA